MKLPCSPGAANAVVPGILPKIDLLWGLLGLWARGCGQDRDEEVGSVGEGAQVAGGEGGVEEETGGLGVVEEGVEAVAAARAEADHGPPAGDEVGGHAAQHLDLGAGG